MSYSAFILLQSRTELTLEIITNRLITLFSTSMKSRPAFLIEPYDVYKNSIRLSFNSYSFYISLVSASYVLEEAKEIASQHPNKNLDDYGKRIEITSDEDPDMEYFNDYLYIMEELSQFEGAVAYDSMSDSFI